MKRKREFIGNLPYVILALIMLLTCFQHIFTAYFSTFSLCIIEAVLCTILLIHNCKIRINKKLVVFFVFYCVVTVLSFIYFIGNLHFEFIKEFKNIINATIASYVFIILWDVYGKKRIDCISSRILNMSIVIEAIYYFTYKFNNIFFIRLLSFDNIVSVFEDYSGRFQGSLAEPVLMGFWIGIIIYLVLLYFDNKLKYIIVLGCVYILFVDCKAKFAILAFPLSIIFSVLKKIKFHIGFKKYGLVIISLSFLFIGIIFAYFGSSNFYKFVGDFFGQDKTYATRFYFPFSALRNCLFFPLGTGYGWNCEFFYINSKELITLIRNSGLDTTEIYAYAYEAAHTAQFISKETLSYVLCNFGFFGFGAYMLYFLNLLRTSYKKNYICQALIIFVLLESIITVNIFEVSLFPFVIMAVMVLNAQRK